MTTKALLLGAALLMPMTLAGGAQAPESQPGANPSLMPHTADCNSTRPSTQGTAS